MRIRRKETKVKIMLSVYDKKADKKATNLSINNDLLFKAKRLKINLSATLEQALENELRDRERENWSKHNKQAIKQLNKLADENGLFSDSYRKV